MVTFTERVNKLVAKIEKWDGEIAERQALREQATAEIVGMLGGVTSAAKTTFSSKARGPLGDQILALLTGQDGLTRDTIASRLKVKAQKVSLSLYHLANKGSVREAEGHYFLTTAARSVQNDVDSNKGFSD